LFYTEAAGNADGDKPLGNRLYRYELIDNKLVNPKLLMDLPHTPGPAHNGGVVAIGPDENVYVVVGNLYSTTFNKEPEEPNQAQNAEKGKEPDGRGGILRITQNGELIDNEGILGDEHPLDMYYAYGIRNSFGIAFDNSTGNLWDTENGGHDEINYVKPGFNSGSNKVTGFSPREGIKPYRDLVDFDGKGKYSPPELDLGVHIAPTAVVFFHSDKFGKDYEDDMFIGTFGGKIFHFNLTENRKELDLTGDLADKISEGFEDLQEVTFMDGLGIITDLEVGPDGYLYGTSYGKLGKIFRILSISTSE
jgi:glucose/arabinose dehydrogenase